MKYILVFPASNTGIAFRRGTTKAQMITHDGTEQGNDCVTAFLGNHRGPIMAMPPPTLPDRQPLASVTTERVVTKVVGDTLRTVTARPYRVQKKNYKILAMTTADVLNEIHGLTSRPQKTALRITKKAPDTIRGIYGRFGMVCLRGWAHVCTQILLSLIERMEEGSKCVLFWHPILFELVVWNLLNQPDPLSYREKQPDEAGGWVLEWEEKNGLQVGKKIPVLRGEKLQVLTA